MEGGSIRIGMDAHNALTIANDGAEIARDIVEQLRTGKRGQQLSSSGLGLWICTDLMELNEGAFTIEPIEKGTRVTLTFKQTTDG